MTDDLQLMEWHVKALFNHDTRCRLRTINDPGRAVAPRFFLGRTPQGYVWRFRHDVSRKLVQALEQYCKQEPVIDDLTQPPRYVSAYSRLLAQHAPIQSIWSGPAYRFPDKVSKTAHIVLVTEKNSEILRPFFEEWIRDVPHCKPFLALPQGRKAVSVCGSVRITPQAYEAGVETSPDFRGRGFAARVVAAWVAEVR